MQDVLAERKRARARQRALADAAKERALVSASNVNRLLLQTVNRDAVLVHKNQKDLEDQAQQLAAEAERFSRQTARWLHAHNELNAVMERLVGIDGWAKDVESKIEGITDNLEVIASLEHMQDAA